MKTYFSGTQKSLVCGVWAAPPFAVVFWPSVFLEAKGTKAQKPHILQKRMFFWPFHLRRQGPRTIRFWKMCVVWPWCPKPPQNYLTQHSLRDPFDTPFGPRKGKHLILGYSTGLQIPGPGTGNRWANFRFWGPGDAPRPSGADALAGFLIGF
jgi:hypothetical protein